MCWSVIKHWHIKFDPLPSLMRTLKLADKFSFLAFDVMCRENFTHSANDSSHCPILLQIWQNTHGNKLPAHSRLVYFGLLKVNFRPRIPSWYCIVRTFYILLAFQITIQYFFRHARITTWLQFFGAETPSIFFLAFLNVWLRIRSRYYFMKTLRIQLAIQITTLTLLQTCQNWFTGSPRIWWPSGQLVYSLGGPFGANWGRHRDAQREGQLYAAYSSARSAFRLAIRLERDLWGCLYHAAFSKLCAQANQPSRDWEWMDRGLVINSQNGWPREEGGTQKGNPPGRLQMSRSKLWGCTPPLHCSGQIGRGV